MNSLIVDARWNGNFGIGRYSREIIQRLPILETNQLAGRIPTHFHEVLKKRNHLDSSLFYSPGFLPINSKCKQVLTLHDLIHLKSTVRNYKYHYFFNKMLLPKINRGQVIVNTVSNISAREIAEWAGLDLGDVLIAPNGISTEILFAGSLELNFQRQKTVLYVGNSKRYKNLRFFLEAVQHLDKQWKIDLVGSDIQVPKNLMRENMFVHSNISESELCRLYGATSVLAVTSIYEGFGMPALEGAYLGTKILLLHNLPSISEILGQNYFLAEDCSPKEFANRIMEVHESLNPISEDFRLNLPKRFSWDNTGLIVKNQLECM